MWTAPPVTSASTIRRPVEVAKWPTLTSFQKAEQMWAWIVLVLVILAALILRVVTTRADSFTASQQFDPSLIASWIAPASTEVPG